MALVWSVPVTTPTGTSWLLAKASVALPTPTTWGRALKRARVTVSLPSVIASWMIGMVKARLVTPLMKVSVPLVGV